MDKFITCKRTEMIIILSIVNKWGRERAMLGGFVRFVDGNKENMDVDNMTVVPLVHALENPDWVVDWDLCLRPNEIRFVNNHRENFRNVVATLLENGIWRTYRTWKT